jgi:hypothetical protein
MTTLLQNETPLAARQEKTEQERQERSERPE